eukprot:6212640-Pleurochrysis_carterae.AAC.2
MEGVRRNSATETSQLAVVPHALPAHVHGERTEVHAQQPVEQMPLLFTRDGVADECPNLHWYPLAVCRHA